MFLLCNSFQKQVHRREINYDTQARFTSSKNNKFDTCWRYTYQYGVELVVTTAEKLYILKLSSTQYDIGLILLLWWTPNQVCSFWRKNILESSFCFFFECIFTCVIWPALFIGGKVSVLSVWGIDSLFQCLIRIAH